VFRRPCNLLRAAFVILAGSVATTSAAAHGFGPRYSLPIPLGFYLIGARAVVALSFAMVALFLDPSRAQPPFRDAPPDSPRCR